MYHKGSPRNSQRNAKGKKDTTKNPLLINKSFPFLIGDWQVPGGALIYQIVTNPLRNAPTYQRYLCYHLMANLRYRMINDDCVGKLKRVGGG